jgi:hypothetical protein
MFRFMLPELERESRAAGSSGLPVYSNSTPKSFNSMFSPNQPFSSVLDQIHLAAAGRVA